MDSKRKNHLRNLAIVASSGIPAIGGPISVLLDKYLPSYLEDKRTSLLNELNHEIERILRSNPEFNIQNERFYSLFMKCMRLALEEDHKEKVEAFKNIILNAVDPSIDEADEISYFVRLVQDLTVDQIRIVKGVSTKESIFMNADMDLFKVLCDNFPHISIDYMMAISQELLTLNLVRSRTDHRNHFSDTRSNHTHFLTALGERFVKWITKPDFI